MAATGTRARIALEGDSELTELRFSSASLSLAGLMALSRFAEMARRPEGVPSRYRSAPTRAVVSGTLWILVACLGADPVRADDRGDVPGYREAVAEALSEYEAQNYLEARTLFERAHKLYPNARTLRGLGIVAFELHHYSESVSLLEQALASDRRPLDTELRVESQRLLERARAFVGELAFVVVPDSAEVRVDGGKYASAKNGPIMLDIGPHELEFRADGFVPERRSFAIHGGERETWHVSLQREGERSLENPAPSGERSLGAWQKGLGIGAIGLGAGALVTAGLLTRSRHREGERYRRVSPDDGEYPQAVREWVNTRSPPYIFAGLGAVTLGSGAIGLILGARERRLTAAVAAGISGVGGIGLITLAIVNLSRGRACGAELPDRPRCSDELEQLDRGALYALYAAPLFAISLAQLLRRWSESTRVSSVAVLPRIEPAQAAAFIDLRGMFL